MAWWDLRGRIEDEDTAVDINGGGWDTSLGWGRISAPGALAVESRATADFPLDTFWRLVSLPVWATGLSETSKANDPNDLFFAGATKDDVLWWDNVSGKYLAYDSTSVPRVGAGRGYWVKFRVDPPAKTYAGAYGYRNPAHSVVVHLLPGPNMIGTPGTTALTWDSSRIKVRSYKSDGSIDTEKTLAQAASASPPWAIDFIFGWDTVSHTYFQLSPGTGAAIQPFQGYWFYAYRECDLLLPAN